MSNQLDSGPVRTAHADVVLASVGERGVLRSFYDEYAAGDLMQDVDGTPEARELATRIGPAPGPVLELAAGAGRLTFPFLTLGFEVTALELSTQMLATLQRRLEDAQPDLRDRCTTVHADMGSFALGKRFPAVVISTGSINILDDAERAGLYASVREHLEPDGRFLFSVLVPGAATSEALERRQELSGRSGRRYLLHAKVFPVEKMQEITIYPADETSDPFVVGTSRLRLLEDDQIVRELEQAGFDVIARAPFAAAEQGYRNVLLVEAALRSDPS
ncbi:daptide-type RiPP biosynthesis methyltransferase [Nocardia terpenica]|uniref:SAM-dependent methyltransferase n=1 Tax=Nocardia terpenica TaxID=455432 RepID=A0A291RR32_9NOCA|nr:daptide-type RiPP biosynthesis methyltransferase [Nocardia terpenica]ATL69933.1 SAM-dependent methyltransferase [Nocardia terpenica]